MKPDSGETGAHAPCGCRWVESKDTVPRGALLAFIPGQNCDEWSLNASHDHYTVSPYMPPIPNSRCGCCGVRSDARDPDPWEGQLDGYCYSCALSRCDAYPGDCPVTKWANRR